MTPDKLEQYVYDNNVITLYNQVIQSITAQIIKRISAMDLIGQSSKYQLQKIIDLYGQEIFDLALEETGLLSTDMKKEVKSLFEQMINDDLTSYEQVFVNKDLTMQLNANQTSILNLGLKETQGIFSNLTKTIAFQSQQLYVNTVDRVYLEVSTGAMDYTTSITNAYRELTEQGVTLTDSLGRNVQVDVAIRRNLMMGLQKTANSVNEDLEKELGCDGYETTAHLGARPSHAEWQGHQFAITKEDGKKYNLDLWTDKIWDNDTQSVEEELDDYNCRHTAFGIILGISKPQYTDEELKNFKEATVPYKGEEIPMYEATQKQRAIENNLRKSKKAVANTQASIKLIDDEDTLTKLKTDLAQYKQDVTMWSTKYSQFNKETGLYQQINRTRI